MNLSITSQKEQPLMNRVELTADLSYEGATPSRVDIKKALASQLNTDQELIIITKISTQYGFNKATVSANVYKKKEDILESEYMMKRQQPKSKGSEEEKPAEQKKEGDAQKEEKPQTEKNEDSGSKESAEEKPEENKNPHNKE
ncbi:hypothetical protein D6745_00520 [Candidatus Woesearchaeota archaeon]|nr:MAG: hypothetical protein D6745_00520 [Candidatus Woesearchaeota archaeon]